jgi:hypothetical protein
LTCWATACEAVADRMTANNRVKSFFMMDLQGIREVGSGHSERAYHPRRRPGKNENVSLEAKPTRRAGGFVGKY